MATRPHFTSRPRKRFLGAFLLLATLAVDTHAQIFFTGALQYYATGSGGNQSGDAEYDTFSPGTNNSMFTVNSATGFAYSLSVGTNTFTLGSTGTGTAHQGLGLFFSNTATTFAGPAGAAPHLVVVDAIGAGTTFSFATGGSTVATYGQYSGTAIYSGTTSYQVGGFAVTVTTFDHGGSANLQLSVAAIPEPASNALIGAAAVLGMAFLGRRVSRCRQPSPALPS